MITLEKKVNALYNHPIPENEKEQHIFIHNEGLMPPERGCRLEIKLIHDDYDLLC